MAYEVLAEYYDKLNEDADYGALFCAILHYLKLHKIHSGIIADLGCGTGEMSLRLAKEGYDMIAVDASVEMLCVARQKAYENEVQSILFLQQNITQLDLYGTINAAICTFDTLNHIGPYSEFCKALKKTALFLEPNCPFIFDMNTIYKHEKILANNAFEHKQENVSYEWQNTIDKEKNRTQISIVLSEDEKEIGEELFYEYYYSLQEIENACRQAGLKIVTLLDGESFGELIENSSRYFVVAKKAEANNE